ncbi:PilW family protein [Deinococcus sp. VB343]|uniref:Prepilin-type N-terminal cleavage/methylation domain-containing protein n=1 Tax=Deinococcus sp. VB142 TaxID=3112952 RepID=A0AAU6PZC3_9DEIO
MNGKTSARLGFTLIELLLAMAITLMLLGLVFTLVMGTNRLSGSLASSALSQHELLNAQELLGSRVREAAFIVPSGTSVTLPNTAKTRNLSGSATTVIGAAATPMLALVLPPRTAPTTSSPNCNPTASPPVTQECYRFIAYYPVRRSAWLAATVNGTTLDTDYPGASPANDAAWVLVEFTAYYATHALQVVDRTDAVSACNSSSAIDAQIVACLVADTKAALLPANLSFSSGTARLLLDGLVPGTVTPTYNLFTLQTSQTPISGVGPSMPGYGYGYTVPPYVSGVTFQLAAQVSPARACLRRAPTAWMRRPATSVVSSPSR